MADVHTKKIRSYNMSQIRSKDTKPEILVRKLLFSKGLRYRLHDKKLPGKPDIVLPKYKAVIFVNGCFWHGHKNCKKFRLPKTNSKWWKEKIQRNIANDSKKKNQLKKLNYRIFVFWECQIKKENLLNSLIKYVETKKEEIQIH